MLCSYLPGYVDFIRRHSLRETDSVTVPLIIGTMLDLDEDECESLADIQKV